MGTICIYHANCADGFTAAWAVRAALGENVKFYPGVYGEEPPDVTDADVLMVDFSYKRPVIDLMARRAGSILILDHHKTAAADLQGLPLPVGHGPIGPAPSDWGFVDVLSGYDPSAMADWARSCNAPAVHAIFDMERAGAQLAWDFFHPGEPRPPLVEYVADHDLWRHKLEKSKEISAWLYSHKFDFGTWTSLAHMLEDGRLFLRAIAEGEAIERKRQKDLRDLLRVLARNMVIGGVHVPVADLPHTFASDAGNIMARGAAFAATYFDRADGTRVFSLRSEEGMGWDVSEIARKYGGGGHKHAAGFTAPHGWEGEDPL